MVCLHVVASVTNGLKNRTVHNWTHLWLTAILRRACLTPHWLQHLRDWILRFSWADDTGGKLSLRVWEWESWPLPPHHVVMWWHEQGKNALPLAPYHLWQPAHPLTNCSIQGNRRCTLPRQHSRTALLKGAQVSCHKEGELWRSGPSSHLP